jgi:lipid-A-disaccharide synthase-like uncharacterized protein
MSWDDFGFWLIIGLVGQVAFFSRFLVQWITSERAGRSTVPTAFWYLSLTGSALLLSYAIHRQDPVFILGQSVGSVVYVRNLMLLGREQQTHASGPSGIDGGAT